MKAIFWAISFCIFPRCYAMEDASTEIFKRPKLPSSKLSSTVPTITLAQYLEEQSQLPSILLPSQEEKEAIFDALCDARSYDPDLLEKGENTTLFSVLQLGTAARGLSIVVDFDAHSVKSSVENLFRLTFRHSLFTLDLKEEQCTRINPAYYTYFLQKNSLQDSYCKDKKAVETLYKKYASGNFPYEWENLERRKMFVRIYNAGIVLDIMKKFRAQKDTSATVNNQNIQGGTVH